MKVYISIGIKWVQAVTKDKIIIKMNTLGQILSD